MSSQDIDLDRRPKMSAVVLDSGKREWKKEKSTDPDAFNVNGNQSIKFISSRDRVPAVIL